MIVTKWASQGLGTHQEAWILFVGVSCGRTKLTAEAVFGAPITQRGAREESS